MSICRRFFLFIPLLYAKIAVLLAVSLTVLQDAEREMYNYYREVLYMANCKLDNIEEVEAAIEQARQYAADHGVPLTIERVCVCIGIDRSALLDYVNDRHVTGDKKLQQDIAEALKGVYQECNATLMEHGLTNAKGQVMSIFACKANYGYDDKVQHEVSITVPQFCGADKLQD